MTDEPAQRYDVIIGGGSFAGLTLACALGTSLGPSLRIAVVERQPIGVGGGFPADGRAFSLTAGSRHLLEAIGVWSDLAPHAEAITGIDITDTSLEAAVRLPVLHYDNRLADDEPAAHVVESRHLRQALLAAARRLAGLTLLDGRAIGAWTTDAASTQVTLDDGTRLAAPLLVAADGRASGIRIAAGIKSVSWSYPQTGLITFVDHEKPHEGRATQHFLPAGPFAILPLAGNGAYPGGGRACVTWTEESTAAPAIMALDDAGFLAELERRFGTRLGALSLGGPRSSYPLDLHLARSFVANRCALIGDAAHTVHPIAGQGLNLALRDVAALVEVICDAARLGLDIGSAEPLARYERWRRFDSVAAAMAMDGLNRLFSNDWVLARTLRDAGLGIVDRLPGLKRFLVRQAAGVAGDVPKLLRGRVA